MARPEKWKDEYLTITQHACKLGATDKDLSEMLNISLRTIYNWRSSKPDFAEALQVAKDHADNRVERALYQLAIEGNVTAQIFWLKNRRRVDWRDKHEIEQTGDNAPVININLKKFEE